MSTFIEQAKEIVELLEQYKHEFLKIKNENLALKGQLLNLRKENGELKDKVDSMLRLLVRGNKRITELERSLREARNENASLKIMPLADRQKQEIISKINEKKLQEVMLELEKQKGRVELLEQMNRKLLVQIQNERYAFSKIIEKGKKRMIAPTQSGLITNDSSIEAERVSKMTFVDLEPSDDFELNDIKAMVNVALQHGNSIENIKNSLINAGYKKEKIEKVIS